MAAVEAPSPDHHPVLTKRRSSIVEPPAMSTSIVFGISGHHQFSLTESILQRTVFDGTDPNTILTTKTSGNLTDRNVTLVNTPNLGNHDLFHYTLKKEVKKAVCFSCPGPHAILFTLDPLRIPENVYDIFKPVVQYFGEHVLNNTMIVLYSSSRVKKSVEDSVKENKQFKELLEKCSQRYLFFIGEENKKDGHVTKELFESVDEMVREHRTQEPRIFSNLEFKDADRRIRAEEKILESQRKKEVRAMLEELKKTKSGEDLEKEVEQVEEKIRLENRERAEVQIADRLGFTLRLVDYAAAIGKGAFAGGVLAAAMGFPGIAIGAAFGAAVGGLIGGAAEAAWNVITNALADIGRNAT